MRIVVSSKGEEIMKELISVEKENNEIKQKEIIEKQIEKNAKEIKQEWEKLQASRHNANSKSQSSIYFEEQEIQPEYKNEYVVQVKKPNLTKSIIEKYNNGPFIVDDNYQSSTNNNDNALFQALSQSRTHSRKESNNSNVNAGNDFNRRLRKQSLEQSKLENQSIYINNNTNNLTIDEFKSTNEKNSSPRNKLTKQLFEQYNISHVPKFKPTVELKKVINREVYSSLEKKLEEKAYFLRR